MFTNLQQKNVAAITFVWTPPDDAGRMGERGLGNRWAEFRRRMGGDSDEHHEQESTAD